jgi:hypothetical protein
VAARRVGDLAAVEGRFEFVPVGVVPSGEGLADAGRPVAQPDVAVAADGVAELDEASVLLGDENGSLIAVALES